MAGKSGTEGHLVIALSMAFGVITAVAISLRLFTRYFIVNRVGLDDILMLGASLLSWAFIIAAILATQHGLGDHIEDVMARGIPNLILYAQIIWMSSIFYNACLGFIKTSVLTFYLRLGDRNLRRVTQIVLVIVTAQAVANCLTCILQCSPINAAWDVTITNKTCVNINAFYLANAVLNIATDLITYSLPIRLALNLQVSYRQKLALLVMFSLGFFACISSIIRITFIPGMLTSTDPTFAITKAMYWSVIETNVGILAASIPSFKPFAKKYLPRLVSEYSSSNSVRNGRSYGQTSSGGSGSHRLRNPFDRMSRKGGVIEMVGVGKKKNGVTTTIQAGKNGKAGRGSVASHKNTKDFEKVSDSGASADLKEMARTESEERIVVPNGHIGMTTDVTTFIEDDGDATTVDGDAKSRMSNV